MLARALLGGTILLAPLVAAPIAHATRLCMLPADLPFEKDDERRDDLERAVARHFEREGIEVVSHRDVNPVLTAADERSGAIFDPATGWVDDDKRAAFDADVEQSLRDQLGCTGLIHLSLHQVIATYDGTNAIWDGQKTRVNSGARIATRLALGALTGVYVNEEGWVAALSLWIRVLDLKHNDIAFRSAGVEPLVDFSYSRDQDLLPLDRWLRDQESLEGAVASALGPELSALKAETLPPDRPGVADFHWE